MKRFAILGLIVGFILSTLTSQAAQPSSYLATAEYDSVQYNMYPLPALTFAEPYPDLGRAGSHVDATYDQGILTIYLLSSSASASGLSGTVTYRRASQLGGVITFPDTLFIGAPGTVIPYAYYPLSNTIVMTLPH